jgi:VWFA-related protein
MRRQRVVRQTSWLLLALSAALGAHQQPPSFRSSVDVVSVDAIVVHDDGRPVAGLGPEDFSVTVDGVSRPVVSAQYIGPTEGADDPSVHAIGAEAAGSDDASRLPEISTNDLAASGRIVLLIIDRTNIRLGEGSQQMAAVARFVRQLSPGDRIGLHTFPAGGPDVDVTSDREAVIAALATIRGIEERRADPLVSLTISEALRVESGPPGPRAVPADILERNCQGLGTMPVDDPTYMQQCRSRVQSIAGLIAREARRRAEDTLTQLGSVLESLRYVEGTKSVVFVSEGLVFDPQVRTRLQQFGSAAAATGTNFYAIQLYVPPAEAAQSTLRPDWDEDRRLRADGLSLVTAVSGGALFRPAAGLDSTFVRVARELSARYVLGFQVTPADRDGKVHRIEVRLKQPHSRIVRHRTEFTAGTRPSGYVRRVETLPGALSEPMPISALPLRVATYVTPEPGTGYKVLIDAEIGTPGTERMSAQIAFDIAGEGRRRVAGGEDSLKAAPESRGGPLRFTTAVPLARGRYRLKFAAKDASGRIGSVDHPFVVAGPAAGEIAASSLMLYRPAGTGATRPELIFEISQNEPAFGAHLIAQPGAAATDGLSAVLEVADAARTTRFNRTMTLIVDPTTRQHDFEAHVPTTGWQPGAYMVTATLLKGDQRIVQTRRTLSLRAAPAEEDIPKTPTARATVTPSERDMTASDLVRRASAYVGEYAERSSSVVADEHYVQAIVEEIAGNSPTPIDQVLAWRETGARNLSAGVLARRQLRSDLLMVKTSAGWYTNYRDVAEVDGEAIKNRAERALKLFANGGAHSDLGATLRQISEEGARYDLGRLRRTVNVPTLALFALHPAHVARFSFEAAGTDTVDGTEVLVLSFRERQRPTFIITADREEVFTSGRLWIAADNGRVLRTELGFDQTLAQRRVRLDVEYTHVGVADLLMPSRMRERYVPLSPSRNGRTQVITGEARYTNFRVFTVTTKEQRE